MKIEDIREPEKAKCANEERSALRIYHRLMNAMEEKCGFKIKNLTELTRWLDIKEDYFSNAARNAGFTKEFYEKVIDKCIEHAIPINNIFNINKKKGGEMISISKKKYAALMGAKELLIKILMEEERDIEENEMRSPN